MNRKMTQKNRGTLKKQSDTWPGKTVFYLSEHNRLEGTREYMIPPAGRKPGEPEKPVMVVATWSFIPAWTILMKSLPDGKPARPWRWFS